MKLLNKTIFWGMTPRTSDRIPASKIGSIERVCALPLIVLVFCAFLFLTPGTLTAQTVYLGQSPFLSGGTIDKYPALVILGEYNPAGPSITSLDETPAGMVQDVKVDGQNYNFTLYAIAWVTNGPSPSEQTFEVVSSQHFSGSSGLRTFAVTNFVVNSGNLLAFAGIGPFDIKDTNGLDATYACVSNIDNTTLSGVPGTTFSVANDGTPNAEYEYLSPGSRTYDIGVDILVTNGCYTFFTIAGQGTNGAVDGLGTNAIFNNPEGIAAGSNIDLFVSDTGNNRIRKISGLGTNWLVTTIAGSMTNGSGSADGVGTNASFYSPEGIAVSSNETLFVADFLNDTIRMITPVSNTWVVSTISGIVGRGGTNDGPYGTSMLWGPEGIAVDAQTNVYVADTYNDTIRKITLVNTNWITSTIAGRAEFAGSTDGTNGAVRFFLPEGIALDSAGNLYVADTLNDSIRKLAPVGSNWISSTIAGTNTSGSADGTNSLARFNSPGGIVVDASNNVYVADTGNNTVREIIPTGPNWIVSTIGGEPDAPPDNNDGTGPEARFINVKTVTTFESFISLGGQTTTLGVVTTNVIGTISPGGYTVGVTITPNSAILDNAMWSIQGFPFTASGKLEHVNSTSGALTLVFSNIPNWIPPSGSLTADINAANQGVVFNVSYTATSPALSISKASGLSITGASNATFEVDSMNNLLKPTWAPLQLPGKPGVVTLYPGTNQLVANWHDLTNATFNVSPEFYRAKWTGQ
jgi:hypothetical protein